VHRSLKKGKENGEGKEGRGKKTTWEGEESRGEKTGEGDESVPKTGLMFSVRARTLARLAVVMSALMGLPGPVCVYV
jgi:hypothetical protein